MIQHTYFSSLVDFSKTWLDIHHKSSRFTTFGHVQALKKIGASPDSFYIPVLFWFFCTSLTKRGDSWPKSWKSSHETAEVSDGWWKRRRAFLVSQGATMEFLRRSTWSTWSINKESQNRHFFQGQWHHVDSPVDTQNGNLSGNIFLLGCELLATRLRCAFVIVDAIHGEFLILEESHRSYSWRYPHDIPIVVG